LSFLFPTFCRVVGLDLAGPGEYVGENLHALKKSLGQSQTTEYTQSGDCRFLAKMQETAQYSKNGFYKQVLDFHSPFKNFYVSSFLLNSLLAGQS
jgi:hypothetical protein